MSDITITPQQMYDLLLKVDRKVTEMVSEQRLASDKLADHEERLRNLEGEEDFSRRIAELEADIKAMSVQMEEIKRRLWAIPGASVLIAAAAVAITLVRTF